MNAFANWIQIGGWLLLGVALLLLAASAAALWRWPGRPRRWASFAAAGLAAGAIYIAMQSVVPPPPLTMAECLRTLSPGSASALASRPSEASPSLADQEQPSDPVFPIVGLSSGPPFQTYDRMARELMQAGRAYGVNLQTVPSSGTIANMTAILSPRNIALGFVQADLLESNLINQRSARVVMPLYPEEIHILTRREVSPPGQKPTKTLEHLSDLVGRRVLVSDRSDGSRYTMDRLLQLAGAPPKATVAMEPVHALCSVILGEADAVGFVAGQPVGLLGNLQRLARHPAHPLDAIHFMRLEPADLTHREIARVSPVFYEKARIERGSYPWAFERPTDPDGTDTLSVRALLVAYDFSSRSNDAYRRKCKVVADLVRLMSRREFVDRLCQEPNHQKWCSFKLGSQGMAPGWQANACLPDELAQGQRR